MGEFLALKSQLRDKVVGNVGVSWAGKNLVSLVKNAVVPTMPALPTTFSFVFHPPWNRRANERPVGNVGNVGIFIHFDMRRYAQRRVCTKKNFAQVERRNRLVFLLSGHTPEEVIMPTKQRDAVIEQVQPKRTAAEIAAAAAEHAAGIRRTERAKDVREWRRIVHAIAEGQEPDGATLAAIAILTQRLELPEGSLAKHVAAVQLDAQLVANAETALAVGKAAEAEMAALGDAVRAAEQRLADLRSAAYTNVLQQQDGVWQQVRLDEHRAAHPLLFAGIDTLDARN